MSRIGKQPIPVPSGVEVKIEGNLVKVKGPKGKLERTLHHTVKISQEGSDLVVTPLTNKTQDYCYWGLSRSLVNNMVIGVSVGYKKTLTLIGVGYRAAKKGSALNLTLGFSHPVVFEPLPGIDVEVVKNTTINVTGADKEAVGETAAKIRAFRPPEPYHGKGVRYADEHIITKVGKAAGKK